jgi:hypothetical protein
LAWGFPFVTDKKDRVIDAWEFTYPDCSAEFSVTPQPWRHDVGDWCDSECFLAEIRARLHVGDVPWRVGQHGGEAVGGEWEACPVGDYRGRDWSAMSVAS